MFNMMMGAGPFKSGNNSASGVGAAENSAKKMLTKRALRLYWRLEERRTWRRFTAAHVVDGDETIVRARFDEWSAANERLAQLEVAR